MVDAGGGGEGPVVLLCLSARSREREARAAKRRHLPDKGVVKGGEEEQRAGRSARCRRRQSAATDHGKQCEISWPPIKKNGMRKVIQTSSLHEAREAHEAAAACASEAGLPIRLGRITTPATEPAS